MCVESRRSIILVVAATGLLWWAGQQTPHLAGSRSTTAGRSPETELTPLTASPLPPTVAFTTVVLAGFRGLAADLLWLRATALQDEGRYIELVQLADWITVLEPQFSEVWPHGTPIALNACLEKALNSEPAARFPNAGRFQEELETLGQLQLVPIGEAVTSTEPVTPRHIDVLTDSPVPSRRRPGWKLLRIFVALIVLVGVGVGFGVGRCTLPPQSSLTITSMADALGG